jgi:hypothetical protein
MTKAGMDLLHTSERICPCCGSRRLSRSHRRGLIERYVLSALRMRPYRCDVCDSRFYKSTHRANSVGAEGLQKTA